MSLDTLTEILTSENRDALLVKIAPDYEKLSEPARFMWGIVYERRVVALADREDRRSRIDSRTVHELIFEGLNSRKFYIVRDNPLNDISPGASLKGAEDVKYRIFGKRRLYISFFSVLNHDNINGEISNDEYMEIYNAIKIIHSDIYSTMPNRFILDRIMKKDMIRRYLKGMNERDFQLGGVLIEYLEKAKEYAALNIV